MKNRGNATIIIVWKEYKSFNEATKALSMDSCADFMIEFDLPSVDLDDYNYHTIISESEELVDGCYPCEVTLTLKKLVKV